MKILVTGGSGFIGTHLIESLLAQGHAVRNLDIAEPKLESQRSCWQMCDILEPDHLLRNFQSFSPDWVVHLAARTDMEGKTVEDYRVNYDGTRNVLLCAQQTPSVKRLVVTSTQFVHRPGSVPKDDLDFNPHTVYGESKVLAEKYTRQIDLTCTWTIIRPTNIYGAWHPRYPVEFWAVLSKGYYIHPVTNPPVVRCYGYVKTIVWQIERILTLPAEQVHKRVFYVSDPPIQLLSWVDAFSLRLTGRKTRRVPAFMVQILGMIGDILSIFKIRFPITTSRYHSMTENYRVPLEATFQTLGTSPYSLDTGVDETVEWLATHKGFKRYG